MAAVLFVMASSAAADDKQGRPVPAAMPAVAPQAVDGGEAGRIKVEEERKALKATVDARRKEESAAASKRRKEAAKKEPKKKKARPELKLKSEAPASAPGDRGPLDPSLKKPAAPALLPAQGIRP